MRLDRALRYVIRYDRFDSGVAQARALYWLVLRRWETEICQHCGRPVRLVWWCHSDRLWELVTGKTKTPGSHEAAGGVWCITCFDLAAREHSDWIEWAPLNLRHHYQSLEESRMLEGLLSEFERGREI